MLPGFSLLPGTVKMGIVWRAIVKQLGALILKIFFNSVVASYRSVEGFAHGFSLRRQWR